MTNLDFSIERVLRERVDLLREVVRLVEDGVADGLERVEELRALSNGYQCK